MHGQIKEENGKSIIVLKNRNLNRSQALYLDRDGVVIEDMNYISDPADVRICPGVDNIMKEAKSLSIPIIIVTNQSGIERGRLTWDDYHQVTKKMIELLAYPEMLYGIYANSSVEFNGKIEEWRKPGAGMIIESSLAFNIELETSTLIGDRMSDLQAGINAGMRRVSHLLTGHGSKERANIPDKISSNINNERKQGKVNKCHGLEDFDLRRELVLAKKEVK